MTRCRKYPKVSWIRPEIKRKLGMTRAKRVYRLRKRFGLTQIELATVTGVCRMTVWNWEHGVHPLSEREYDYMLLKLRGL